MPAFASTSAAFGPANAHGRQLVADVLDLDLVHDDVALEQRVSFAICSRSVVASRYSPRL